MENSNNVDRLDIAEKAAYSTPVLTVFGSVRNLTGGSTGGHNDGLGPSTSQLPMSDMRAKENIVQVGSHPAGFGLYLFDFKAQFRDAQGAGRQFGVMAQEVAAIVPEAVSTDADGWLHVDYSVLGITRH